MDDYFEDRVKEEITAKGLTPGDLVGELPDPNPVAAVDTTVTVEKHVNYAAASASAIYKPGGPTTYFGGDGLGPFQGELAQTRRAMFVREGVGEENWMWMMAVGVREANAVINNVRKERMMRVPEAGVVDDAKVEEIIAAPGPGPALGSRRSAGLSRAASELVDDPSSAVSASKDDVLLGSKQHAAEVDDPRPLGVYEPHTGLIHCAFPLLPISFLLLEFSYFWIRIDRADTQPTRSRLERVETDRRPVLGGTTVGSGAWGIAYIDTIMEFDDSMVSVPPSAQ